MINIFSFFSGAGFQDLGFELQGNYDILFVNEYHKSFNPSLIPDNYFQQFLEVFVGLTVCLSATAS